MDKTSIKWKDMYCCAYDAETCKRPKACVRDIYDPSKWGYMLPCSREGRKIVPFATSMMMSAVREGRERI